MLTNQVKRAFSGGEVAPNLYGRADLALYQTALRTCRNFQILRAGGIANRAGFLFLGEGGDMSEPITLYAWVFTAADQSTLIELGDHYMRFWIGGELATVSGVDAYDAGESYDPGEVVTDSGNTYVCIAAAAPADAPPDDDFWYQLTDGVFELPTPWAAGAFNSPGMIRSSQNKFELVLSHPSAAPQVLTNGNATGSGNPNWSLAPFVTAPSIEAPDNLVTTPGAAGTLAPAYVVTAVKVGTYEESLPSALDVCGSSAAPTEALPNELAWDAVTDAVEYRIYKDPVANGTFGYIGTATGQVTFNDPGYDPDFLQTPPVDRQPFASAANYPEMCGYYQQRQVFGYTDNEPAGVWTSRVAHLTNFTIRSPLQDDDAVTFRLDAPQLQVIRHIVPLARLVLLTNTGEWVVHGDGDSGALAPASINPRQHGWFGASRAFPSVVGNVCLYVQEGGTRVREVRFNQEIDGLGSRDLSVLASHLFDDYTIVRTEYQKKPHSVVWALRSDGALLGLTYVPEEEAIGWHRHDTVNGVIEDICVLPEEGEDVLYLVVRREIDGNTVRYIERMAPRPINFTGTLLAAAGVFVDSSITKTGASSVSVTGLDHLEGEEVYGLADGVKFGPLTVEGGAITLATAASTVHVGLRITAQFETLDLDVANSGARDRLKRVQSVGLVTVASGRGFYAGKRGGMLYQHQAPAGYDTATIKTGYEEVTIKTGFDEHGRILVQHTDPTPLTVVQVIPRFEVGG